MFAVSHLNGFNAGGAETDPNFSSVVALLHMNGTDASTTFTDVIGKTWTAVGNAQIDTAQSKFGGASGLFDGTGDYITTPDHADFNFTGNFTVEMWVRLAAATATYEIFGHGDSTDGAHLFLEFDGSARGLYFQVRAAGSPVVDVTQGATTGWSTNTWYHVAVTRATNDWYVFRDGTQLATVNDASGYGDYSTTVQLGAFNGGNVLNGWIDDARVTKGVARYTGNFSAPTSAFPDS